MAGIKSDRWIRRMAIEHGMIEPFAERSAQDGVISYGLSSYGYDMRLGRRFRVFSNVRSVGPVDPKNFDPLLLVDFEGEWCDIPPSSYVLAYSLETFRIPRSIEVLCVGKSTYARCGIIINVTPIEPEWHGVLTLEISNATVLPARVYANEGIAQLLFLEPDADDICEISYADKQGKYQAQRQEVTLPRV